MKILIFVAFLFVYAVSSAPECPPNKEFKGCGSGCPPTCKDPNPKICTTQCVSGCFCKNGFLLNHKGECVTVKECDGPTPNPECPPRQQFEKCGTACPPTCKNPGPQPCTKQCVPGCFCNAGLVKNDRGECVALKDCPAATLSPATPSPATPPTSQHQCPPNKQFLECGTACPPTCKTPTPELCTLQCIQGCFCKAGLVKNDSGECVALKDCPAATPTPTMPTAATPTPAKPTPAKLPPIKPTPSQHQLTPQYPSPHSCGKDEVWSNDKCVAPAACQTPRCPNNTLNSLCAAVCRGGGCVCKKGFYRDDHNNCVRLDMCNVKLTTPRPMPTPK